MRYLMFSKHLQTMADAGRAIKDLGFDGVELTVRPGGHVEPERVAEEVPRAVAVLHEIGLDVPAIVTDIKSKSAP